ncbi:MAG: pyrroloquinoline quinone biosynthesis peptide chaperone PqqD [Planctomycetaceae bacterium]|nr:pyrroloquinoline quinone biosynthesis peptide chaperone PqqD [Planctomycetaceae bacterium]
MTDKTTLKRPILSPHVRYRWDSLRRQHQLIFPEGMLILNPPSAAILTRCDGRPLDALMEDLVTEFPSAKPHDDVRDFLEEMTRRGFVHEADPDD